MAYSVTMNRHCLPFSFQIGYILIMSFYFLDALSSKWQSEFHNRTASSSSDYLPTAGWQTVSVYFSAVRRRIKLRSKQEINVRPRYASVLATFFSSVTSIRRSPNDRMNDGWWKMTVNGAGPHRWPWRSRTGFCRWPLIPSPSRDDMHSNSIHFGRSSSP